MRRSSERRVAVVFWVLLTVLAIFRLAYYSVTAGHVDDSRRMILAFGMLTVLDFAVLSILFLLVQHFAVTRDHAEEALRQSSSLQKAIVDNVDAAIIYGSNEVPVQLFNRTAERWLEYRADEVIGKLTPFAWHDPNEVMQRADQLSKELGSKIEPFTIDLFVAKARYSGVMQQEWTLVSKNGRRFPALVSISPVRDNDGELLGYVGIAADISELRRTQRALEDALDAAEQASRAKTLFLANMSHELRTPLNSIIGFSEMLSEDAQAAGQTQCVEDLKKITQSAKHLLSLINDILDLSKVEAGKMRLHVEKFDVATMIRDVTTTISPIMRQNSNALSIDLPEDIGTISADQIKVRQILFNLLSNAGKFTTNGKVTISARCVNHLGADEIHFTVSDTGIGISSEQLGSLFQPFNQADSSTSSRFGGTGLGLSISRQFCRLMGGDIDVTSQIGAGSTFVVRLPTHVDPSRDASSLDNKTTAS